MLPFKKITTTITRGGLTRVLSHNYTGTPPYTRPISDDKSFRHALFDLNRKIRYLEQSMIEVRQEMLRLKIFEPTKPNYMINDSEISPATQRARRLLATEDSITNL